MFPYFLNLRKIYPEIPCIVHNWAHPRKFTELLQPPHLVYPPTTDRQLVKVHTFGNLPFLAGWIDDTHTSLFGLHCRLLSSLMVQR